MLMCKLGLVTRSHSDHLLLLISDLQCKFLGLVLILYSFALVCDGASQRRLFFYFLSVFFQ